MIAELTNHVWQSTFFAAAVWLLTTGFRKNRAEVRYRLWFAASLKFVIPFALLIGLGGHVRPSPTTRQITAPAISLTVTQIAQPFAERASDANPPVTRVDWTPRAMLILWACGFVALASIRMREWLRVRDAVRSARPFEIRSPVMVRLSPGVMEPGVVGLFRPVLLLPSGIVDSLTTQQFEAVIAHELCHVRRRDNLISAIHMVVEAVFWFHPLVWWIGARLIEERERACDEDVLRRGADSDAYAQGILNVCRFCVEAPLRCVSGIGRGDIRKRIERIMERHTPHSLSAGRKCLLAAAGFAALTIPVVIGFVNVAPVRAQSAASRLTFEIASVKVNDSAARDGTLQFLPGGRFVARNTPLALLIATAYDLPFNRTPRLTGVPESALLFRYDIEARAEKGSIRPDALTKIRDGKMKMMLQSLLEDRFHLKMLREAKEQPVYAIVVASGGPKLKKSKMSEAECASGPTGFVDGCHTIRGGIGRGIHGDAIDIADVALFVQNWTDRPVIDKTGVTDLYDIQTEGWAPMLPRPPRPDGAPATGGDAGLDDPDRQTLAQVFGQLGLKMESQRAVVDMFVVEHLEKPSEN